MVMDSLFVIRQQCTARVQYSDSAFFNRTELRGPTRRNRRGGGASVIPTHTPTSNLMPTTALPKSETVGGGGGVVLPPNPHSNAARTHRIPSNRRTEREKQGVEGGFQRSSLLLLLCLGGLRTMTVLLLFSSHWCVSFWFASVCFGLFCFPLDASSFFSVPRSRAGRGRSLVAGVVMFVLHAKRRLELPLPLETVRWWIGDRSLLSPSSIPALRDSI